MFDPMTDFNHDVIRPVECLSEGKALLGDKYWMMVGICFVGYLLSGMAPFYLLYGPMMCGISYCFLALKRGAPFEFSDLFKGFNFFGPAFLAGLIQMLPVFVVSILAYIPLMIMMFSVQPGTRGDDSPAFAMLYGGFWIVWVIVILVSSLAHLLFAFSFPLVIERKLSGGEAVKLSFAAFKANMAGAIGLFFLCGLVNMGGALLCGIGVYLTIPITHAAWTIAYRRIFPEFDAPSRLPPDPPKWRDWDGQVTG
jgi:uncharacterized membrane protein